MDDAYDYEAFQEMNWDRKPVMVEGEVVEIPSEAYADNTFFVTYFEENEKWDEYVNTFIEKMDSSEERVRGLLESENFRRCMCALLSERDIYMNKKDLTRLAGTKPEENYIERMEEMDILDVEERDGEKHYRLVKDSDAYWFLQISASVTVNSDENSLFGEMFETGSETQLFSALGSQATSWDEFLSTWEI